MSNLTRRRVKWEWRLLAAVRQIDWTDEDAWYMIYGWWTFGGAVILFLLAMIFVHHIPSAFFVLLAIWLIPFAALGLITVVVGGAYLIGYICPHPKVVKEPLPDLRIEEKITDPDSDI